MFVYWSVLAWKKLLLIPWATRTCTNNWSRAETKPGEMHGEARCRVGLDKIHENYSGYTLPETNIAPEKWWLEDEFPFGKPYFREGNPWKWWCYDCTVWYYIAHPLGMVRKLLWYSICAYCKCHVTWNGSWYHVISCSYMFLYFSSHLLYHPDIVCTGSDLASFSQHEQSFPCCILLYIALDTCRYSSSNSYSCNSGPWKETVVSVALWKGIGWYSHWIAQWPWKTKPLNKNIHWFLNSIIIRFGKSMR